MSHPLRGWRARTARLALAALLLSALPACAPRPPVPARAPAPAPRVLLRYRPQAGQRYAVAHLTEHQVAGDDSSDRIILRVDVHILSVAPNGDVTREVRVVSASKLGLVVTEGLPGYREVVSARGRTLSHSPLDGGAPAATFPREVEYPEEPVAPGSTWTATVTRPVSGTSATSTHRLRMTLERIERRPDGSAVAHIRTDGEASAAASDPVDSERMLLTTASLERASIDLATGVPIDSQQRDTIRIRSEHPTLKLWSTSLQWHAIRVAIRPRQDELPPFELLPRGLAPPLDPACRSRIEEFRRAVAASHSGWVIGDEKDQVVLQLPRLLRNPKRPSRDPIPDPSALPKLIVPKDPCCVEFLGRRMSPGELRPAIESWLAEERRQNPAQEGRLSALGDLISRDPRPELFLYVDEHVPARRLGALIAPLRETTRLYLVFEDPGIIPPGEPPPHIAAHVAAATDRWDLGLELFYTAGGACEPVTRATRIFQTDDLLRAVTYIPLAARAADGMERCGCEFGDIDVLQYTLTHLWSIPAQQARQLAPDRDLAGKPAHFIVGDLYFE